MRTLAFALALLLAAGCSKPYVGTIYQAVPTQLNTFKTCLLTFRAKNGRYPTQSEGLAALVRNPDPATLRNWTPMMTVLPLDPWGNPYRYVVPAPGGVAPYGVYSCGPDGISKSGGDDPDDQNTWNPNKPWIVAAPQRVVPSTTGRLGPIAWVGSFIAIAFIAYGVFRRRRHRARP